MGAAFTHTHSHTWYATIHSNPRYKADIQSTHIPKFSDDNRHSFMSCLSSDPPKIRLGVGGSGGSQEIRRPLQRSSVLDDDKRSMASYRCSDFLIFRNLGFPLAVGFSDPLGLDPPGSLGLCNSKLGGGLRAIKAAAFHAGVWCEPPLFLAR